MGTRGFVGFVADGVEKIAYNHWDSYPGGLGVDVLNWLRSADITEVHERARALRVVGDTEPTDEDIASLSRFMDASVGRRKERPDWYQLLRHTQGKPALILEAGALEDASGFPLDSLFAEWGYLVDFDAGRLEVYEGFQQQPHGRGRFAGRVGGEEEGYYPCALVQSWPLTELPDDKAFVQCLEGDEVT